MRCEVIVKVGDISRTSRTTVSYVDPTFDHDINALFAELTAHVDASVALALRSYEHRGERVDSAVYLRPSATTPQRVFQPVTAENFVELACAAQGNYARHMKATGPFVCELFLFVMKPDAALSDGIRRATASRLSEAAVAMDDYLASHPEDRVGEIARTHWVLTQAHQPNINNVSLPDTATFRQMRHIDAIRGGELSADDGVDRFASVMVRLNGSSDLSLSINIAKLRRALGLPPHNLLAEGVFSTFIAPAPPAEDIQDIDHMSDTDSL